jgi:hypothetical protein
MGSYFLVGVALSGIVQSPKTHTHPGDVPGRGLALQLLAGGLRVATTH